MAKFKLNFDKLNFKKINFSLSSTDLGVDLGTSNVVIYVENKGLELRAPSVVAMDKNTGRIIQVYPRQRRGHASSEGRRHF